MQPTTVLLKSPAVPHLATVAVWFGTLMGLVVRKSMGWTLALPSLTTHCSECFLYYITVAMVFFGRFVMFFICFRLQFIIIRELERLKVTLEKQGLLGCHESRRHAENRLSRVPKKKNLFGFK